MQMHWMGPFTVAMLLFTARASAGDGEAPTNTPKDATTCVEQSTNSAPLIASWPGAQKAALDTAMQRGLVVLALDGCRLRVLEQCHVDARYKFVPSESATRSLDLKDETVRKTSVLGDYAGIDAYQKRGEGVALELEAVGSLESSKAIVLPTSLEGNCEGATHYVTSVSVGRHAVRARAQPGKGEAKLIAGNAATCAVNGDAKAPAKGCDEKLMVQLAPANFVEPIAPRKHDKQACPDDSPRECAMKCMTGNLSACTNLAWMLEKGRSLVSAPARAATLYRAACFGGQQLACNNLGTMFLEGRGVDRDDTQAFALFKMACRGDYAPACGNLGTLHRDGRGASVDAAQAVSLFGRACSAGDAKSCSMVGRMFASGKGTALDLIGAKAAFAKGCALREVHACNNLAAMLLSGEGGSRDEKYAARLFALACAGGLDVACRNQAYQYATGLGVLRDPARAAALLDDACKGGLDDACQRLTKLRAEATELGDLAKGGPKVQFKLVKTACEQGSAVACTSVVALAKLAGSAGKSPEKWLAPLCDKGQASACTALGDALALGGKQNLKAALERYQVACNAGDGSACRRAGLLAPASEVATRLLEQGCGAADADACGALAETLLKGKDGNGGARAQSLLEQACFMPHAPSCKRLAQLYQAGTQVTASTQMARDYYERACNAGEKQACAQAAALPAAPEKPDPLAAARAELEQGAQGSQAARGQ